MRNLGKSWPLGITARSWPFLFGGFVVLLVLLSFADVAISRHLVSWPEPIRDVFHWITRYGEPDWLLLVTIKLFLFFGAIGLVLKGIERSAFFQLAAINAFIALGVGLPGLVANLFKRAIGRARPLIADDAIGPLTLKPFAGDWQFESFPSGHSTIAFAMAMVFGFLAPRYYPWALGVCIIIAFSRIPENMHYPTDVFGGFVLGTLGAFLVRNVFAARGWLFKKNEEGAIVRRPLLIAQVFGFRR